MATQSEVSQQLTNTLFTQTRRSALKKMLVGTGLAASAALLPSKWTKPIVNRVLVPAHAKTSDPPSGPCSFEVYCDFAVIGPSIQLEIWRDYKCPGGVYRHNRQRG